MDCDGIKIYPLRGISSIMKGKGINGFNFEKQNQNRILLYYQHQKNPFLFLEIPLASWGLLVSKEIVQVCTTISQCLFSTSLENQQQDFGPVLWLIYCSTVLWLILNSPVRCSYES